MPAYDGPPRGHEELILTPEDQVKLREPFKPEQIGKLPRAATKKAKDDDKRGKCLPPQEGGEAPGWQDFFCGKYHVLPAVHMDYVGHAAVTDRLLSVDICWTWRPVPEPPRNQNGEFWIELWVKGMMRYGVGDDSNTSKTYISDALRNAAMRFGVALDLWHRDGELYDPPVEAPEGWGSQAEHDEARASTRERVLALPAELQEQVKGWLVTHGLTWPMTRQDFDAYAAFVRSVEGQDLGDAAPARHLASVPTDAPATETAQAPNDHPAATHAQGAPETAQGVTAAHTQGTAPGLLSTGPPFFVEAMTLYAADDGTDPDALRARLVELTAAAPLVDLTAVLHDLDLPLTGSRAVKVTRLVNAMLGVAS